MFGSDSADGVLMKLVNQKLLRGGSQSRISATVQRGTVTITGNLQYDAQRAPLVKSVACIAGVRRVVDQLQVKPRVNQYAQAEARAVANAKESDAKLADAKLADAKRAAEASAELASAEEAPAEEAPAADAPTT
jgi:hypothetical protein